MKLPHFTFPKKTFNAVSLAIIGAAVALLIAGIIYFTQQEMQREAINAQTHSTNQLILQVKAISELNQKLNEENRNYAYCNAVLLAKYTQTQEAIVIEDLNKCLLNAFPVNDSFDSAPKNGETALAPDRSTTETPSSEKSDRPAVSPPYQYTVPLVTVPNLLQINIPCIDVFRLIRTCKQ